ncbi:bifunctional biotin--[acetyl-CoA-carboxylase] ligase/biotin operon repressor BirA [Agarilytica rhodophyticola]|uniref:bifunctional biotin--[acetyl-CoA-carboxylase] ligase/biotin operon repressor BirA n=1 Tax=Agarilytica rhodophyticola TaxID=1737490 RepID=UPI001FE560B7|nr:bifunctional biotin--[acetyl-CoA-carboxylase] ligase/biotin operon repressor BirA [Agarilytica rhodophyticola]
MINESTLSLLRLMSDGSFHSGESLGALLGISRAAVWKNLQQLADIGIQVESSRGLGYCIAGGLSLIDKKTLANCLPDNLLQQLDMISVLPVIDSTNKYLFDQVNADQNTAIKSICLAEMQTGGRGRRGRVWQSPFARNLYLSIAWPFDNGIAVMEGLSLAVGVAIAEALEELGLPDTSLKWPNDILYSGAKLGGVLIEIVGDMSGQCHVVVGVGLNVAMPEQFMLDVDQAWTDIKSLLPENNELPSRSEIAGIVLKHLLTLLSDYQDKGFAFYRQRWQRKGAYCNQEVSLVTPSKVVTGKMLGVSETGAVILMVDNTEMHFVGGEISLRVNQ